MTAASRVGGQRTVLLLLLSALALAILISLGTWQVRRLAWKQGLIATIEERIVAEPVSVEQIVSLIGKGEEIEYRPVRATGRFAHQLEQYFFATHKGASGWYVYTPLVLADSRILFVNRGFVPYDFREPDTRPRGQITGEVTITGLARSAPDAKPSFIVPDNDPATGTYYWKDLRAMREAAGFDQVLPFFLDVGPDPNPGGLPVGGVTIIELPNNHLQYAITWYGLALALVGVLVVWYRRQRGSKASGT